MRLCCGLRDIHGVQLEEFAKWLLQIGDGLLGDSTGGESVIRIPNNLLLDIEYPCLHDLVLFIYPNVLLHSSSVNYFKGRSILAPTLDVVIEVNNHVMSLIPGNERIYLSSDTLINEDGHMESELYTLSTESLNTLNCSEITQHRFTRRQFLVALYFAMTINKSQGQTLSTIGVYLPRPVFTHGQLYIVLSRVSTHSGLKILSVGSNSTISDHIINVIYRKVFAGLLPNILP
ncbi:uncharacterized protein LOC130956757 [Arachis stenosperma]|uniref:uncharacterized protein LOC130956757 n=1 Tax=Arachis stenosperma TaxID=217475 RepID=UPI0025AB742B|nr:uncharacterized protein LOC130956757 [Arachis stenosperma]